MSARPNDPANELECRVVDAIWCRFGSRYFDWPIALEYARAVTEALEKNGTSEAQ